MLPRLAVLVTGAALLAASCVGEPDAGVGDPPSARGTERGTSERGTSEPPNGGGLLDRLRDGGLTIVVRHAATNQSRPDHPTVDLADCTTQRNLSQQGRSDARLIGRAFGRLRIPVGEIWASPYCRSKDTARLAFGRYDVVDGLERLYPKRDERADSRLNRRIRDRAPHPGEPNLIIASHGVYPSVLGPGVTIAEGEAAVYDRAGNGFDLVDRIEPAHWTRLDPDAGGLSQGAARVPDSVVAVAGPGGNGSAFQVAVRDVLVTSAHLVAGAREVAVTEPNGRRVTATVLGRDDDIGVAALRVAGSGLPSLHSGTGLAEARTGDLAFAVGAEGTVTPGAIRTLREAILVDVTVPRRSAGGPLINEAGSVLGVLTTTPDGDVVSVPVDQARSAVLAIVTAG